MTYRSLMLASIGSAMAMTPALAQDSEEQNTEPTEVREATVLRRVVVSAGAEKVAITTPQAVTVVDQEDLNAEQATTIGDALRDLPGVTTVGSDRVLGESFNIRGFGTATSSDESRIIVQVDGATKFHEQYRLGSLFTDPELYKSVEVLRGPASSTLYGSGALAGVITLETKDASDFLQPGDRFGFNQKLEGSTNGEGFLSASTLALAPTENTDVLVAINYREADALEDGDGVEIDGSDFETLSTLVKGSIFFGPQQTHTLSASYQYWLTEDDGAKLTQTETSPVFGLIDREVQDTTAILKYEYLPTDNDLIDFSAQISYSESDVDQKNSSNRGAFGGSALFQDTNYAYEFIETRFENTATFTGKQWENYLTVGLQTQNQTRTADSVSEGFPPGGVPAGQTEGVAFHPGGESDGFGVYVQNEFIYQDRLTLIPGLRYDQRTLKPGEFVAANLQDEQEDTAFSPKLAAFYQVTPIFGTFGSISYTERMPVIDEVFDTRSGNFNLDNEESINYEAGFTVSLTDVLRENDEFALKGTAFRNEVENLIERLDTSSPYFNVGEAEIEGFELEGSYEGEIAFARLAYTLIRGEGRENEGDPIEPLLSIPADEVVLTLGGRAPRLGLDGGVRILGAFEQDEVPEGRETTPGYVVLDVFSSWRAYDGPAAGLVLRFGVENVLDHTYREALATNLVGDNAKGRTFKFTISRLF